MDEITAFCGLAEAAALDVVDADATQAIRNDVMARHGRIDIFMANAGVSVPNRSVSSVTPLDFARVIVINLIGVMNGVLAVVLQMRAHGQGTLILTSSWHGQGGIPQG